MIHSPEILWSLPFVLYAETHYRFKYFFSYLRKAEPELIADAPHRLEPGEDIPLLILAKDGDRFPARLRSVRVQLRQSDVLQYEHELITEPVPLDKAMWWNIFRLKCTGIQGWVEIHVFMTLECRGKVRTYRSDNHRTSSHAPLRVYLSSEPLPHLAGLHHGDAHTHSDKTSDQVEFGVPIHAAVPLAESSGLTFFCVADHSYDLDDSPTDYGVNDPEVPKWKTLSEEIQKANSEFKKFAIVQGEEVSCRNSDGKNVHFLLLGNRKFFHGSGDSAEQWFRTNSENSITDILAGKEERSVAFAAHPSEPVPLLQRLLLARGSWTISDFSEHGLNGIQFANGVRGSGFVAGYTAWVEMLLRGRRLFCLAGNDAHGNFNRFRQIGVPFVSIRESDQQLFGKMRTAVYVGHSLSERTILHSLGQGAFIITDGPCLNITASTDRKSPTSIGKIFKGTNHQLTIRAQSTREFGSLSEIIAYVGVIGEQRERVVLREDLRNEFEYLSTISAPGFAHAYLRIEAHTSASNHSDGRSHFCITNPIWFMNQASP